MERDLSLIRTKRAEKERAAAGSKPPSPSYGENTITPLRADMTTMNAESGETLKKDPKKNEAEDVIMTNGPSNSGMHEEIRRETGENQLATPKESGDPATSILNVGVEGAVESVVSAEATENAKEEAKPNQTDFEAITQPAHASGTPTIPDFQDVNFESMFNDNGTTDDNDQMEFNLDFTNDASTAEDFLNDSAFENIAMGNEEVKNLSASNEDINTLLPGLESYVNAGEDFSLTDVPGSNSAALPEVTITSEMSNPAVAAPVEQAPIESNFDDFFASVNYMDEGGDDDMGGDGGLEDFDAWFTTDINKPDGS